MPSRKAKRRKQQHEPGAGVPGTPSAVARPPISRRRRWLLRLAAATLVPALFFLVLEGALRLAGYGYPTAFWLKAAGREAYTANPRFGWRFFARELARAPVSCDIPAHKDEAACRIFVLGSSAAMGTPDPAFGLARFLEVLLRERYPGVRFEVVNAAMTAINSHAVLTIARDCLPHQPDVLVVYVGNNEFVGPYGPGTVFAGFASRRALLRASLAAKTTRTGQLLEGLLRRLGPGDEAPGEWQGMEMFLGKSVPPGDPRADTVYEHFRANLSDLCEAARGAGVPLVVCTLATNLRDCAPFASAQCEPLSESEQARWDELYRAAIAHAEGREYATAAACFVKAAEIDGHHAELHFRLAQCCLALGQLQQAKEHFVLARDCDALRFRADSAINEVIREVAGERQERGVLLVDAEQAFAVDPQTEQGLPGCEWFYEHVHLKPEANYLLARTVLDRLESVLPDWVRRRAAAGQAASLESCCERLALSRWDRYRMAAEMEAMTGRPPFTGQFDHASRCAAQQGALARLEANGTTPTALDEARRWYLAAIERDGGNAPLRANYAKLLKRRGEYAVAEEQLRIVLQGFPETTEWCMLLADVLSKQRRGEEALAVLQGVLRLWPWNAAKVHYSMGVVQLDQGERAVAVAEFHEALALDPNFAMAANSLGACLLQEGRLDEALAQLEKAVRLDPLLAKAHANLGSALLSQGKLPEAEERFRQAVQLVPRDPTFRRSLAGVLLRQKRAREAIAQLRQAVEIAPQDADLHHQLGTLLEAQGQLAEALNQYETASQLDPGHLRAGHNRAAALARFGRTAEAVEQYRRVIAWHPNSAITLNNLAWLLATARNALCRDGAEAVRLARRACEQTGQQNPILLTTLAAAHAENGQFDQAVATADKALELARTQNHAATVAALKQHLNAYRQGQPWRAP